MSEQDQRHMKRALALARKGVGKTSPNPAVGCVVVKDGRVVGEGWHRKAGLPHAEVNALSMAGSLAQGADVFVTLEPCSHTGRTPPCAKALIAAGVRRVVAGMVDPNPLVAGKGFALLRKAGIMVEHGVMEAECRAINRPFIKHVTTGLPYVTYKCAMTLDGNIATVTGESQWISCPDSRRYTHRLRAAHDAIMVGVDTIIADNPQLTVRHVKGRNPLRIILDTRLRTPESVGVLSESMAPGTIIATTESNPRVHLRYTQQGATVIVCDEYDGRVSMVDLLQKLGKRGIQSILLEGGSRLAGEMLQNNAIDEFIFFLAPKIIGSDGFAPFTLRGITSMDQAIKLQFGQIAHSGQDIIVHAWPAEAACSPA
ncbi:bifunctional diaminohydroxyphosphoribosylaminopyrimidine deaminase/5-amino-6-(5-phosphoribosylamino)uracil reductase RibD [Oryzomonas sagensis]|uniref:Riboflavin biosynthesis protein RibD n=1 Tax=Oryzomonas sagensis TaxID=2603857 RepID=A0ABQ6TLJ8_9BACT|nr:bifunctional diaminohydroxyphosphoribosylaminopyrimidine deaminase/5-amino-6-(5-phosphoribosylamino)uracil reductase RibD [Oryzomonas sagensis]KAB0669329.1 bifunctional diaminohydroxyphosphoribosylaminopyrimidine deaminase/5-amino-6-(5-phosphoribosylamino)uracil reductase RibD [Oryzomonas sagensis]